MKKGDGKPKKKRSFSDIFDKYETYDTSEGFGSPEQWKSAFEARMNFGVPITIENKKQNNNILATLFEAKDANTLKKAYWALMKLYHPDIVGEGEGKGNVIKAQLINDTYFELKDKF